jgi:sugar O-acyltransferase (sialic acid O-acetyltransferase NeuD family)
MKNTFSIVGYSGHSFVILDSALRSNLNCTGYYDFNKKFFNPYKLKYLGLEGEIIANERIMITIGDNNIRRNVYQLLVEKEFISFLNIIDPSSSVSRFAFVKPNCSISIGANTVINSLAKIEDGVIVNTGAIIEHEVSLGKFSHIGPNATVCGNAKIGENVFIGANAIIKQGTRIEDNSIIGAGAVVIDNILANSTYVGNPAVKIK